MPTVPRVKGPSVSQEPMPGPRVTVSADEETFGGGAANRQIVSATTNLNTTLQTVLANQKQAADEVKGQDYDLQAGILQNKIEAGVRNMKGVDAAAASEYVQKEWNNGLAELDKTLKMSPEQKSYVRKAVYARTLQLNGVAQDHMAVEFDKHDEASTLAYIENARNTAAMNAGDPDKVKMGIAQQENAFLKRARRKGFDKEQITAGLADIKSDTHISVIDSLIGSGEFDMAEKYLKENRKQIVGEAAKRFDSDYVKAQKRKAQEVAKYEMEQRYDQNLHQTLIDDTEGNLSYSELYRRWRTGELKDTDFKAMEARMRSPEYGYTRLDTGASPDQGAFNAIREAQLSGEYTQGQIDRMIQAEKQLGPEDRKYLINQKVSVINDPKDQRIAAQAKSVADFGSRYFETGWFGWGKKEKDAETQALVSEFYKRVDKENADGERVDEIAKEVIGTHIKKKHPEINRLEDVPHIIIGIDGKIKRLFAPEVKTKTKPMFKITRNKITEQKEPKKK